MATYEVATRQALSPAKQLLYQLIRTGLFLLLYAPAWRVIQGRWPDPLFLEVFGVVFFLGNLLTAFLWPRKESIATLDIDDDEIRLIWSRKVVRTVRRDHLRYVREWGRGPFRRLVVSERGPAFTRWLWGGIGVPASLPEYEQIKAQALTWLASSGK
jgi:hypothetical protein